MPPPIVVAQSTSEPRTYRTVQAALVKFDEAFVDFWSDALTNASVTRGWPRFTLCQFRAEVTPTLNNGNEENKAQKLGWLVEARATEPQLPVPVTESEPTSPVRRANSPRPSERSEKDRSGDIGRVSSTFDGRKRFDFFESSTQASATTSTSTSASATATATTTPAAEKRESKTIVGPKAGELGEVIPEEAAETAEDQNGVAAAAVPVEVEKKEVEGEAEPVDAAPTYTAELTKAIMDAAVSTAEAAAIAEAVEEMAEAGAPNAAAIIEPVREESKAATGHPENATPAQVEEVAKDIAEPAAPEQAPQTEAPATTAEVLAAPPAETIEPTTTS